MNKGYNSAVDYIEDGHSNQKFYAGKCKDNVAILELDNWKISSNAEISNVINALKNKERHTKRSICM